MGVAMGPKDVEEYGVLIRNYLVFASEIANEQNLSELSLKMGDIEVALKTRLVVPENEPEKPQSSMEKIASGINEKEEYEANLFHSVD